MLPLVKCGARVARPFIQPMMRAPSFSTLAHTNPQPSPEPFLSAIKHPSPQQLENEAQFYEARAWYLRKRSDLLKSHPFQFVAVSRDGVVACGDTKMDVLNALEDLSNAGKTVPPVVVVMVGLEDQQPGPLCSTVFPRAAPSSEFPQKHEAVPLVTSLDLLPLIDGEEQQQTSWPNRYPRYSYHKRPYLSLAVKKKPEDKTMYPLTFLVDTGSPCTYIASNLIKRLGLIDVTKDYSIEAVSSETKVGFRAVIDGIRGVIQPSENHGNLKVVGADKYINLLGTDFLRARDLSFNWKDRVQWEKC